MVLRGNVFQSIRNGKNGKEGRVLPFLHLGSFSGKTSYQRDSYILENFKNMIDFDGKLYNINYKKRNENFSNQKSINLISNKFKLFTTSLYIKFKIYICKPNRLQLLLTNHFDYP